MKKLLLAGLLFSVPLIADIKVDVLVTWNGVVQIENAALCKKPGTWYCVEGADYICNVRAKEDYPHGARIELQLFEKKWQKDLPDGFKLQNHGPAIMSPLFYTRWGKKACCFFDTQDVRFQRWAVTVIATEVKNN